MWCQEHAAAFDAMKKSLASAPVLILPDTYNPFHVHCDASDVALGCALMQFDEEGCKLVANYQLRRMKPAKKNYPIHDKKLLEMRYPFIKFCVNLLGERTFALYTDYASLRNSNKESAPVSTDGTFVILIFRVQLRRVYRSGKTNILADALSRRPDYDPRSALSLQK